MVPENLPAFDATFQFAKRLGRYPVFRTLWKSFLNIITQFSVVTTIESTMTATKNISTIIYVEDNQGDALLLKEALTERHHDATLVIVENGAKALHYFEVKATVKDVPPPHCILLDTHLPVVTGLQLIEFIRGSETYKDTPVYIFASEHEYTALKKDTVISPESFLVKPMVWEGFLELADLLMKSADANRKNLQASPTDDKPEVHAEGELRLHP